MAPSYKLFLGGNAGVSTVPNVQGDTRDTYALQVQDVGGLISGLNFPPPYTADLANAVNNSFGHPLKYANAQYSFAINGGAVSTIGLTGLLGIPSGSIILGGFLRVTTLLTSATSMATVALQVNAANDVVAAAVVSGAPWSTTGMKAIVPVFTNATYIRTTAARDISAVIAVEALTAGAFNVCLLYVPFS